MHLNILSEVNITAINANKNNEIEFFDNLNDTNIYVLKNHIETKNVNGKDYRLPNNSFKSLITNLNEVTLNDIIKEILLKVYTVDIKNEIEDLMGFKNIEHIDEYKEDMNERFKFTIEHRLQYNNKKYVLEIALAVQASFLTAKNYPIYKLSTIRNKNYDKKVWQIYINLRNKINELNRLNANNINYKPLLDNLQNLSGYKKFVLLISGFSTFFKVVNDNWEYDYNDRTLNYDISEPKYDIYTKYPISKNSSILINVPNSHIKKEYFNNTILPSHVSQNVITELYNFEKIRWEIHKILSKQ